MSFLKELQRRNVFRVAIAYAVASWVLLQVADLVLEAIVAPGWVIKALLLVVALGFVVAVVISWVYELTPDGIRKEKEVDRAQSITALTGRRLDRIIIAFLAVAVVVLWFRQSAPEPEEHVESIIQSATEETVPATPDEPVEKSIAVLPFVNMSEDPGNEYFSDGISEELLNLLAKVSELRVISRSSAFSFKGKSVDAPSIAQQLNVAHILEGSVRKSGNRVRITAQLIEARSDTHLWSKTYDRTLNDIFIIQDEISAAVVDALKVTLLGEVPRTQQIDPEAYALYLQAMHMGSLGTDESLQQSNALLKQVLAMEPDYARAWRGLSRNYGNQVSNLLIPRTEGLALAREAVDKALAVDPEFAEAYSSLAFQLMVHDRDIETAARYFQRALSLEPKNETVLANAGALLAILDRINEALALDKYLAAKDPLNSNGFTNLALDYFYLGQYEDTVATVNTLLMLSPQRYFAHNLLARSLLYLGDHEAALEAALKESMEHYRLFSLAMIYHTSGQKAESDAALAELIEKYGPARPYHIAGSFAYRGNTDESFSWLEKAEALHTSEGLWLLHDPMFANLHDDPRWLPFLESIGMSSSQLSAIRFEVPLPE